MKKLVLITALIALVGLAWGQTTTGPWVLLQEQQNVKIYRSYGECNGQLTVLLKIVNGNGNAVSVAFDSAFNLSGNLLPVDLKKNYTVAASSTHGGDCTTDDAKINPYNYVSTIQMGVSDYIIQNLKIVQL